MYNSTFVWENCMDAEYFRRKRMEFYYANKELEKERRERWRKENPEVFKESQKKSSKKHYEKNKEALHASRAEARASDPCRRILNSSYGNARSRGLEHNIGIADVRAAYPKDNICPILGIPFTNIRQDKQSKKIGSNPSLDRIDNTLGYIPGNIQVISWRANSMKSDASKEELIAFAKGILKLYEEDS